ncbi:MAG TPA: GAF domain-containing protein [Candidatus Limnocylindrales bacterium]|nr:GAF domain-containing protein [Candidatus Limnocylindrales bacterium]
MIEQPASPIVPDANKPPFSFASELRAILDAVPDGVTVQDATGRLVYANEAAARLSGFASAQAFLAASGPELLARFELLDEHDRPFPLEALPGRLALRGTTPEPVTVQFRVLATGERRWSTIRSTPMRDASGRVTHAVNAFQDITARVLAERELRASEARYRLAAEAAADLDESLDLEATIAATAAMAVPRLADWCVIDVLESDGTVRRAAVRVADPRYGSGADALWAYPSVPGSEGLMGRSMVDGAVRLYRLEELDLARITRDERHAAILRSLDPRWAIVVPLAARGTILGAIALVRAWSGRTFTEEDVPIAEELGRRAALAIGNAALYRAEGEARRAAEAAAERTLQLQLLTRALAGAESRPDVARVVVEHALAGLHADGAALYVRGNDDPPSLVALQLAGPLAAQASRWQRIALDTPSLLQHVVADGEDRWEEIDGQITAGLGLTSKTGLVGAVAITWTGGREITAEDRDVARAIADLAGQALERASLAEAREALVADLERQRARLTAVIEQMPGGVIIAEAPEGRIVLLNEQVDRLVGTRMESASALEAYGRVFDAADGRELGRDEWPLMHALVSGERIENQELEFERFTGGRRTILVSAAPIRAGDGSTVAAVATFADITERRAAVERERYLAEASRILGSSLEYEATLARIAELAVPGIADWCGIDLVGDDDRPQRLVVAHVDPAKVELARRLRERYPPDPDAAVGMAAVIRTGQPELVTSVPAELVEAAAQDEEHLAILRALDLRSYMCVPLVAGGRTLGAITFVASESGRRFGEEDLRFAEALAARAAAAIENAKLYRDRVEAQERLEQLAASEHARAAELDAVIDAMAEAILVCDPSGRVRRANPAAHALASGRRLRSYRDLRAVIGNGASALPRLGTRAGPVELPLAGDEDRWIEVSTYPVSPRDAGRPDGRGETIVVIRDITEARRRQTVRETFVGVLSHELRTPVTTIYGGAKLLSRPGLDEERRRAVFEDIAVEAERLHRLVEDVIALNRFGEAEGDVGREPVLLQRVVPSVLQAEEARWPGVRFTLDIRPGLSTVEADRTYVEQVVRNLLSNAAKYGGPGTTVSIAVEGGDDEVRVRIVDDGPGFPPEEAPRLFDLFFRSPSTASSAAGAGIGLFVCARLIRAMGGRIWALPRTDRGAEFGFALRVMSDD